MSPSEAHAKDRTGEKYATLITVGESPLVLIEAAWKSNACIAWRFDTRKRRTIKRDLRLMDGGQLVMVEEILWIYSDEQQEEFNESTPTRISRIQGGTPGSGMMVITDHARTSMPKAQDSQGIQRPAFGDWGPLVSKDARRLGDSVNITESTTSSNERIEALTAAISGDGYWRPIPFFADQIAAGQLVERSPVPPGMPISTATVRSTWHPPRPMQPDPNFLTIPQEPKTVTIRGHERLLNSFTVGRLRLPTGRLIVCDPYDYFLAERNPYTVKVPPGQYRLIVNVTQSPQANEPRVAAGGLLISEEKVASWELALLPGQDVRLLPDGATYGFGVDSGMACFFDASLLPVITGAFADDDEPLTDLDFPGIRASHFGDSPEGAALIAFDSGWGDGRYPVWIGRDGHGTVACLVADMQLNG
ncbi:MULTISPECIES: DUF4241 domain-containing protein [unclassified Streptomyces]|uniref:DUF4241 domain-containing protein n=1 Tax=unclassified Streptomyces TaxID=2593676 RepID=UPI0027D7B4AB|nr:MULTISPECIES: DUF4241 domain-containing protein [unclassified Streptomyces]MDX3485893.1 DUF4241 domain-containing protein [Streptomyces sp. ID05-18]